MTTARRRLSEPMATAEPSFERVAPLTDKIRTYSVVSPKPLISIVLLWSSMTPAVSKVMDGPAVGAALSTRVIGMVTDAEADAALKSSAVTTIEPVLAPKLPVKLSEESVALMTALSPVKVTVPSAEVLLVTPDNVGNATLPFVALMVTLKVFESISETLRPSIDKDLPIEAVSAVGACKSVGAAAAVPLTDTEDVSAVSASPSLTQALIDTLPATALSASVDSALFRASALPTSVRLPSTLSLEDMPASDEIESEPALGCKVSVSSLPSRSETLKPGITVF